MYLDSHDYQTVWKLAHKWCGVNCNEFNEDELPEEVRLYIHRILAAINSKKITVRNKSMQIFHEETWVDFIFDLKHHIKINRCLKKDIFVKEYLDSLYVKRSEVLSWCINDFLEPPFIWRTENSFGVQVSNFYDSSDDDNEGWYNELTERRKQRVACLEMAKKLWTINASQSYEQIYNHPVMKQYGNSNVFSLDAFKKWARPFAPDQIKEGGRPIKNK
jgi:adenylate kinase family enzyme